MIYKKNLSIVLILLVSSFSTAASRDDKKIIEFGSELLQLQFLEFTDKMVDCQNTAKETLLSNSTITELKKMPKSVARGLGIIHQKTLQQCAVNESNQVLRTLLALELQNKEINSKDISQQLAKLQHLLVSDVNFYAEKEFILLPQKYKLTFESIDALKQPFNLMDAVNRAWLN